MKKVHLHTAIYMCCALIISGFFVWKLLQQPNNLGIQDWDQHFAFAEFVRQSISVYHQMPLWNPYHCGGTSLIGFPENEIFSATTLFSLLFGTVSGYKVLLGFYMLIGFVGFYLLGQYYKFSVVSAFVMAITYLLSGTFILPYSTGMTNFLSLAFLPYITLAATLTFNHPRPFYLILLSVFLALTFYSGMHYIGIIIIFLFFYALFSTLSQRSFHPLSHMLLGFILFCLLSAPKLFPSIESVLRFPFIWNETSSGYSLGSLAFSLFSRSQTFEAFNKFPYMSANFLTGSSYGLDENSMYVGIVPFLLFLLGCIKAYKKHFSLLLLMGVLFIIMLGFNANPSIYAFLKQLPLIGAMRIAQRYRFPAMLIMSIFIGHGMQYVFVYLRARLTPAAAHLITTSLGIFMLIDLLFVNTKILFTHTFAIPPITKAPIHIFTNICSKRSYYDTGGFTNKQSAFSSYSSAYPNLIANIGIARGCYESLSYNKSPLCPSDAAYGGEFYLLNAHKQIIPDYYSPNIIRFSMTVNNEDTFIVNQNYDSNWLVITPKSIKSAINHEGLLSTTVNQQSTSVTFVYMPSIFMLGVLTSIVTIGILIYISLHDVRRKW